MSCYRVMAPLASVAQRISGWPLRGKRRLSSWPALAATRQWPLMLVGNGTNVLYADAGARGIVARMNSATWHTDDVDSEHVLLTADGGVDLPGW